MTEGPFERDGAVDKPGIVGARWWQRSVVEAPTDPGRRSALGCIVGLAVGTLAIGTCVAVATSGDDDDDGPSTGDLRDEAREALAMQKEYGWNFGAHTESLVFDGASYKPFDPTALNRMRIDFAPSSGKHVKWWVPTLFEAPPALPTKVAPGDPPGAFAPLRNVLKPISTPQMDQAFARGRALAGLLADADGDDVAVVVDLPGPEAVAFAAGMSDSFDPVFLFDNWPHPRGVVKAHLTLAAAAFYQPLFASSKKTRPSTARPVFVLDRDRLAPYTDAANQFDNRWVAKLPTATGLKELGVSRVLYVVPWESEDKELDDLNEDFVDWAANGVDVRMLGATVLRPGPAAPNDAKADAGRTAAEPIAPNDAPTHWYGGTPETHAWFWVHYPWRAKPPATTGSPPLVVSKAINWKPKARSSPFSSGSTAKSTTKPRPPGFGTVTVVVLAGSGVIQGAKLSRNGSWNRAPLSGGGGG